MDLLVSPYPKFHPVRPQCITHSSLPQSISGAHLCFRKSSKLTLLGKWSFQKNKVLFLQAQTSQKNNSWINSRRTYMEARNEMDFMYLVIWDLLNLLRFHKQEITERFLSRKIVSGNISTLWCFPSFLPYQDCHP